MVIDDLMVQSGASIYYDDGFRNVLEDHMTVLRNDATTRVIDIDAGRAYKYESDLYGLLQLYNVPTHLHWLVMRMNRLTSPMDYPATMYALLIPDPAVIERLRQSHMTTRTVS